MFNLISLRLSSEGLPRFAFDERERKERLFFSAESKIKKFSPSVFLLHFQTLLQILLHNRDEEGGDEEQQQQTRKNNNNNADVGSREGVLLL